MRTGLLARLRRLRRCLVQAVVLAFVLPALVGLLPQPALSAAAALDRDLLLSVCGQDMPQPQDGGRQPAGHDHCVLCGTHCPSCSPSLAAGAPAFAVAPRRSACHAVPAAAAMALPLKALIDASPPRGPPAAA